MAILARRCVFRYLTSGSENNYCDSYSFVLVAEYIDSFGGSLNRGILGALVLAAELELVVQCSYGLGTIHVRYYE